MSLRKRPTITAARVAASRANGRRSRGPATAAWRERIRSAHQRHGFDAQAEELALRALGEDPAQFQELLEALWETYDPTDAVQEGLVIRLARATWLMNRADRMQEGYAVRQAQEANVGRQERLHLQMMRLRMTAERLLRLVKSVARDHYVTPPADLEAMKSLHQEGVMKDMGEIALALFCQLQAPGTDEDGLDEYAKAQLVVAQVKEIFGIGMSSAFAPKPNVTPLASQHDAPGAQNDQPSGGAMGNNVTPAPSQSSRNWHDAEVLSEFQRGSGVTENNPERRYSNISPAEWEARERPRQLLENILTRQADICEAQRKVILKESLAGPSPYERAAEIAPTHPNAKLMRRMQDANFREVRRVTNMLLKLKRQARTD